MKDNQWAVQTQIKEKCYGEVEGVKKAHTFLN